MLSIRCRSRCGPLIARFRCRLRESLLSTVAGPSPRGRSTKAESRLAERLRSSDAADEWSRVVTSIEAFNRTLPQAQAGENVGLLLRGVKGADIARGDVIAVPRTVTPASKFRSEVYVLSAEEGGRHRPFFGYAQQFFFRTTDATGGSLWAKGSKWLFPGDNVTFTVELNKPIAIQHGTRFAIREGGRTIGSGVVSEVLD